MRHRRKSLTRSEQCAAAQALTLALTSIPDWPSAQRIAVYLAADGEIDTGPLQQIGREQGKQVFLPAIGGDDRMSFARWDTDDHLLPNRFHIPEPSARAARCPVPELDIIFLPLVAWDRPYKKSVPVAKALAILDEECRSGKLDRTLLDVFVDAKVYERTLPKAGSPSLEVAR